MDSGMNLLARAVLVARDDKSFWEKYKWLIIGGAIAMPIQLVALWFYLRYRKRKKAALIQAQGSDVEGSPGSYRMEGNGGRRKPIR